MDHWLLTGKTYLQVFKTILNLKRKAVLRDIK